MKFTILLLCVVLGFSGCQRTDFEGQRGIIYLLDPNAVLVIEEIRLSTTEFGVDGTQDDLTMHLERWGTFNADKLETQQVPEMVQAVGGAIGAGINKAVASP